MEKEGNWGVLFYDTRKHINKPIIYHAQLNIENVRQGKTGYKKYCKYPVLKANGYVSVLSIS